MRPKLRPQPRRPASAAGVELAPQCQSQLLCSPRTITGLGGDMARVERECATPTCSAVFTATNRYCTRCRTKQQVCAHSGCGAKFWTAGSRFCSRHRYPTRTCSAPGCANTISAASNLVCSACRAKKRSCASPGCANVYRGNALNCRTCLTPARECVARKCSTVFRGTQSRCWHHRAKTRECAAEECPNVYRGTTVRCIACRTFERECTVDGCATVYWGDRSSCNECRKSERECPDCGETFHMRTSRCGRCWWRQLPAAVRAAMSRSSGNAYRARKLAAQVAGPVSAEEYVRVRAEGPCVYCGDEATEVDHVRPLSGHGGWEHPSNLVPACRSCNASKSDRLLIEWDQTRVFRAVTASEKVAAEYERQLRDLDAHVRM
ncbi:HNH endonuclease [Kitasatospora sp. NPDC088134]|uniref:HNH endonuclease n=1 Tax=Kitasatospora sp. NPDC088134 TaxID=3364071 RepID=UPI003806F097